MFTVYFLTPSPTKAVDQCPASWSAKYPIGGEELGANCDLGKWCRQIRCTVNQETVKYCQDCPSSSGCEEEYLTGNCNITTEESGTYCAVGCVGLQTCRCPETGEPYLKCPNSFPTSDSYLSSYQPDSNFGENENLAILKESGNYGLLKFDLSSISPDTNIVSAKLRLFSDLLTPEFASLTTPLVYEIKRDWQEDQVTWNKATAGIVWSKPGCVGSSDCLEFDLIIPPRFDWGYLELDITDLVKKWQLSPSVNHGILITLSAGSHNLTTAPLFASSETSQVNAKPCLTINQNSGCPRGDLGNLDCGLDGVINDEDKRILLNNWSPLGPAPTPAPGQASADLNNDNRVDEKDLNVLLSNWGS